VFKNSGRNKGFQETAVGTKLFSYYKLSTFPRSTRESAAEGSYLKTCTALTGKYAKPKWEYNPASIVVMLRTTSSYQPSRDPLRNQPQKIHTASFVLHSTPKKQPENSEHVRTQPGIHRITA
jgi:hypothetical protein